MAETIEKYTITVSDRNFEFSLGQEVQQSFAPEMKLWIYSITEHPAQRETKLELMNRPPYLYRPLYG